jgi:hypothetical protein
MSNQGRFTWHELMSTDPTAALDFYAGLTGWTYGSYGPANAGDGPESNVWMRGEEPLAGCMELPGRPANRAPRHTGLAVRPARSPVPSWRRYRRSECNSAGSPPGRSRLFQLFSARSRSFRRNREHPRSTRLATKPYPAPNAAPRQSAVDGSTAFARPADIEPIQTPATATAAAPPSAYCHQALPPSRCAANMPIAVTAVIRVPAIMDVGINGPRGNYRP